MREIIKTFIAAVGSTALILMVAGGLMTCSGCEACGYTSVDNELTGQAKKVVHNTPLICGDYATVDMSLGVMRNGVGSMSTQDVWLTVTNPDDIKKLEDAAARGAIVTLKYKVRRATVCIEDHVVESVVSVEGTAPAAPAVVFKMEPTPKPIDPCHEASRAIAAKALAAGFDCTVIGVDKFKCCEASTDGGVK